MNRGRDQTPRGRSRIPHDTRMYDQKYGYDPDQLKDFNFSQNRSNPFEDEPSSSRQPRDPPRQQQSGMEFINKYEKERNEFGQDKQNYNHSSSNHHERGGRGRGGPSSRIGQGHEDNHHRQNHQNLRRESSSSPEDDDRFKVYSSSDWGNNEFGTSNQRSTNAPQRGNNRQNHHQNPFNNHNQPSRDQRDQRAPPERRDPPQMFNTGEKTHYSQDNSSRIFQIKSENESFSSLKGPHNNDLTFGEERRGRGWEKGQRGGRKSTTQYMDSDGEEDESQYRGAPF